jgi:hypothetical protein
MPVGRAGSKAEGVAERFADPAVHKRIAGDLALIPSDDAWLRDAAQPSRARWEKKHDKGPAVTVLAQQWARAVYDRSIARWLSRGRRAANDTGGERMSPVLTGPPGEDPA